MAGLLSVNPKQVFQKAALSYVYSDEDSAFRGRSFAMNVLYFLSSIFLRGFSLLNIIALGWLLGPNEYGTYVVLISAAAFMNAILASWLQASATMFFRKNLDQRVFSEWQATFFSSFGFVTLANVLVLLMMSAVTPAHLTMLELSVIFAITTSMALCELTAAYLNGNGQATHFLRFNTVRSILTVVLGIGAVVAGFGALGAALAMCVGQISALALPESRLPWQGLQLKLFASKHLKSALKMGIPSSLVFGFYPLLQALYRNGMSMNWDDSRAGLVSFCIEVLIAPLVLIGATFSYTIIPKVSFGTATESGSNDNSIAEFLVLIVITCTMYATGMYLLGEDFIRLYFPKEFRESSVLLMQPALLFSVSLIVTNTIAFVLVARGKTHLSTFFVVFCLLYCALAMFALNSKDYVEETWFLAQAMAHCALVAVVYSVWQGLLKISWKEAAKNVAAVSVFYLSLEGLQLANLWDEPVSKGLMSLVPAAGVAIGLRSKLFYRFFVFR